MKKGSVEEGDSMALKSRKEILNEAATAEGASNEAVLMAALNESQEEYKRLSGKLLLAFESYDKRIEALEAAVRASNAEKAQNYTEALKNASDEVLGDVQGELEALKGEVQETVSSLQVAKKKSDNNEKKEIAIFLVGVFVVVTAAFYVALLLYGWWYDIPEAVAGITQHNTLLEAINNGIYQLLQR